ncbi:hypothetical protein JCM11251_006347 [Rhodosporidiobolus azoricus]
MSSTLASTSTSLPPSESSRLPNNTTQDPAFSAYSFSFFPSPPWTYGDDPDTGTGAYFASLGLSATIGAVPEDDKRGQGTREDRCGPETPPELVVNGDGTRQQVEKEEEKGKEKAVEMDEEEEDWSAQRISRSSTMSRNGSTVRGADEEKQRDAKRRRRNGSSPIASRSQPGMVLYKPTEDDLSSRAAQDHRKGKKREDFKAGLGLEEHRWREAIARDTSHWILPPPTISFSFGFTSGTETSYLSPIAPLVSPARFIAAALFFSPALLMAKRASLGGSTTLSSSSSFQLPSPLRCGLTAADYAPYLLRPSSASSAAIDPEWSVAYHYTLLRFLESISSRQNWSSKPNLPIFSPPVHSSDIRSAIETQIDRVYIRRTFPLRAIAAPSTARKDTRWKGLLEVVKWVWGSVPEVWDNVAWVVQELPLPLVALLRQHAETTRYRAGVFRAWQECTSHLVQASAAIASSRFTSRERRGRILLQWLNQGGDVRKKLFFCDEEGRPVPPEKRRGKDGQAEEVWEWWFVGLGQERRVKELDEWEKREMYRRKIRS